jgi:hypothetical protein
MVIILVGEGGSKRVYKIWKQGGTKVKAFSLIIHFPTQYPKSSD